MNRLRPFLGKQGSNEAVASLHDITIPFPGNRTRVSGLEEIGQVITLQGNETGRDYRIYVGLELTHEELEYNRANY